MKQWTIDRRRNLVVPGDKEATLKYATSHWLDCARKAIADHDAFYVALSGGSTPKALFQRFTHDDLDWSKVYLFWSDERAVPPDDPDSNYHMAIEEGGLGKLPIPTHQIHRMVAEGDLEEGAKDYERTIKETLGDAPFDLVMLGMGDDGHTASLFPHTDALKVTNRLVVPNHVPQKETWRMTFTYQTINAAETIALYVLGAGKAQVLPKVLKGEEDPLTYPSQKVGTPAHPALWIADEAACSELLQKLS